MDYPGSALAAGVRKAARVARVDGTEVAVGRALRKGVRRLVRDVCELPLFPDDVVTVPGPLPELPRWRHRNPDDPLLVDFVITPPSHGSGGHTTIFRVVEELERRGHECRLSVYDRWSGDINRHAAVIRRYWPTVRASIHDANTGLLPADAVFATPWETAHVVARRATVGKRMYLVQDYEPDFYPAGTERVLAEATYRFGFTGVTAGRWLSDHLADAYGMSCEGFDFGCDTAVYHCDNLGPRDGVVFYAKPDVPRRAFWLGALALRDFARRHPETPIHLFGQAVPDLGFARTDHGRLSPDELNALYNQCSAGLSLSLTNVSLVPWELLASGCTPVVNDAPHNRAVLDNNFVAWSELAPAAVAAALSRVVAAPFDPQALQARAESVQRSGWGQAGALVEQMLRKEI
jgi:glycosyltransferase involved in cell wall biosynthesis